MLTEPEHMGILSTCYYRHYDFPICDNFWFCGSVCENLCEKFIPKSRSCQGFAEFICSWLGLTLHRLCLTTHGCGAVRDHSRTLPATFCKWYLVQFSPLQVHLTSPLYQLLPAPPPPQIPPSHRQTIVGTEDRHKVSGSISGEKDGWCFFFTGPICYIIQSSPIHLPLSAH